MFRFNKKQYLSTGDLVLMLRDPWGQPIQFVKCAVPMLK